MTLGHFFHKKGEGGEGGGEVHLLKGVGGCLLILEEISMLLVR